jgi:zinc protease
MSSDPGIHVPHTSFALDNGLEVVLLPDRTLPKVVVDLWYDVGSWDDPLGKSGFAHLFEHLMFKGTPNVGEGEFDRRMEAVGASNNASTGDERTNYYDTGPAHTLELLLWLEADRMTGLDITQKKLDVEREVVRNERRQNYEDAPYGSVWLELPKLMFPADHPLSRSGIGEHADLLAATLDDVREFYAGWYVPSNAILAVAGDFDPAAARAWIQRTFGSLPARPRPFRATPSSWPDRPVAPHVTIRDEVALPLTVHAWHTPALYLPGDAELDALASMLSGSDDARLVRRLVYEEELAHEVDVAQMSSRWGSVFVVTAYAAEGKAIEDIDRIIEEELAAVANGRPPTDDEIERSRNNREVEKLYGAEPLLGRAETVLSYRYHLGTYDGFAHDLGRIRGVSVDSVRKQASRLVLDRRGLLHVLPEAG